MTEDEDMLMEGDPFDAPLALDTRELDALREESERYQLMEFLGKRQPDMFFALEPGERYRHVAVFDQQARKDQITAFPERLGLCEQALLQDANAL